MGTTGIAIAVCGPAGHGKSTLLGRLLRESDNVTPDEVQQQWARAPFSVAGWMDAGSHFNPYNWLLLQGIRRVSRRGEDTVVVAPGRGPVSVRARLGDAEIVLTPVDQPDPSHLPDRVLRGLHPADFAVLVVEARCGLERDRHRIVTLLGTLGIPLRGVFVSKMDAVDFSREVFESVRDDVRHRVEGLGLGVPDIVPVHALADEGSFDVHPRMSWYRGTRPLAALRNAVHADESARGDELRFATRECYLVPGVGATLVGTVESGIMRVDDELSPPSIAGPDAPRRIRVRSLEVGHTGDEPRVGTDDVAEVAARRTVAVGTSLHQHEADRLLLQGIVLGHPTAPPSVATRIEAEIFFFRPHPVRHGIDFHVRAGACTANATVEAILDRRALPMAPARDGTDAGESVRAHLRFDRPLCIESDDRFARLRRFLLREGDDIVGCGRCVRILP